MKASPFIPVLLAIVIATALVLLPVYSLISLDLVSRFLFRRSWELGGVLFDQADLFMFGLIAGVLWKVSEARKAFLEVPKIGQWLLLGGLISAAYLLGPTNRAYFTGPAPVSSKI